MTDCARILHTNADRICAATAELVDAESFRESLMDLVEQLAQKAPVCEPLDTRSLFACGADERQVGRLLRAMESEIIELFRAQGDPATFGTCVLNLRQCIRRSVPRPRVDADQLRFYHELVEGPECGHVPEPGRLLGFFQCVMKTMRDMVYVHDTDGNIFYVSDRGLAMTGFSREDLDLGLSVYDFVAPEYVDLVEARLENPGAALRSPYTIEIYSKDGERIPIEIDTWPLRKPSGEVYAIVGVARDLRLERRLEAQLRQTHVSLQHVIANAPIGILITNKEGVIHDANPAAAAMCGAPAANDLLGLAADALSAEEDKETCRTVREVLRSGKEVRERVSMKTRFGSHLECDVLVTPLQHEPDGVHGLLILLVNVREQLALQARLMRSEKLSALGQLVAGVAHELNNPLTGVLGYCELILSGKVDDVMRTRLEQVMDEARRCSRIVQNLLSFARHRESHTSATDVNDLVNETLALCGYQLRADHIAVTTDLQPGLPWVLVDPQDMKRVFLYIMGNAQQALATVSRPEKSLVVSTRLKDRSIHVAFADNGPGIPREHLTRVFDPFFTTKQPGDGVGLGLSVSYGIVTNFGGDILVDSEPDKGATFTVVLPIADR